MLVPRDRLAATPGVPRRKMVERTARHVGRLGGFVERRCTGAGPSRPFSSEQPRLQADHGLACRAVRDPGEETTPLYQMKKCKYVFFEGNPRDFQPHYSFCGHCARELAPSATVWPPGPQILHVTVRPLRLRLPRSYVQSSPNCISGKLYHFSHPQPAHYSAPSPLTTSTTSIHCCCADRQASPFPLRTTAGRHHQPVPFPCPPPLGTLATAVVTTCPLLRLSPCGQAPWQRLSSRRSPPPWPPRLGISATVVVTTLPSSASTTAWPLSLSAFATARHSGLCRLHHPPLFRI